MSAPSYHDLYITTEKIPRTSLFDLPYGLDVRCNRVAGWELWDLGEPSVPLGRPEKLLGSEFGDPWLVLDVDGHVIVDGRDRSGPDDD